jgi:hypothetical protein
MPARAEALQLLAIAGQVERLLQAEALPAQVREHRAHVPLIEHAEGLGLLAAQPEQLIVVESPEFGHYRLSPANTPGVTSARRLPLDRVAG